MFAEEYPGTCRSCGLLGLISGRDNFRGKVLEMDAGLRAYGRLPKDVTPWCFRRMVILQREVDELLDSELLKGAFVQEFPEDSPRFAAIRQTLEKPRDECINEGAWHEYIEFLDPQWHYEDWRNVVQEKLRQTQAQSLENISAEHARTTAALVELQRKADKESGRFNILFFLLALVALVLALGQIGFPNGIAAVHFPGAREEVPVPVSTAIPLPNNGTPEAQR